MENENKYKEDIVENLKDCKYTRDQIVDMLVTEDIEDAKYNSDFVYNILTGGWKGYNDFTLGELKIEYNDRHDEQI